VGAFIIVRFLGLSSMSVLVCGFIRSHYINGNHESLFTPKHVAGELLSVIYLCMSLTVITAMNHVCCCSDGKNINCLCF